MSAAEPFTDFTDDECLARLGTQTFGRLAFHVAGRIEIFPVNYVLHERRILFRTAPGTKLAGTVIASSVAFQVDHIDERTAWSVIAHGRPRHLERDAEIDAASELPLRPWIATSAPEFVEISIERVSGREYRLGPAPLPETDLTS